MSHLHLPNLWVQRIRWTSYSYSSCQYRSDDDDDSSLDGKAEGAGHISESATAPLGAPERAYDVFDNQLAEKKAEKADRLEADTTKESEALKSEATIMMNLRIFQVQSGEF